MKSGQITVFGTFLAYKHKFNFFSSFVPFYCKRPICRPIKIDLCLALVADYQVFTKYLSTFERWIGCKLLIFLGVGYGLDYRDTLSLSKVFHSLTKDTIIHELEEVFFEIIFGFGSEGCIHLYVWLHPRGLLELDSLINMF